MKPLLLFSLLRSAFQASLCLAILFGAAGAVAAPFPVANPGFEGAYAPAGGCANISGEVAAGWGDNTCWYEGRPVIRYARDTVNPRSGLASQKITLVSGNLVQFAQFLSVPTEAGKRNIISFWMRAQAPMYVSVALRQGDVPYSIYASKLVKLDSVWRRHEFEALTPTTDSGLFILTDKPGTFWVDDFDIQTEVSAEANPSPPLTPVPRTLFGMHFNQADTPWPQVGNAIGAVRIWDAGPNKDNSGVGAQWSEVNGAPDFYDWRGLDARVAAAAARGADVLYTLGGRTPRWAALDPNANSPYGPGQCSEPRTDQIWQDWVRTIATRYKGKIKYWEIWNEADLSDFYCGTPERLASLTRLASQLLKQIDPANQVLSPSLAGFGGPGLLDYILAQGAGAHIDIVSYHFYYEIERPEAVMPVRVPNIKALMRRYGLQSKPLWDTEQGWIDIPNPTPIPQATAAAYVARAYLLHWAYGMQRYYYYTWDNQWNQFAFTQADRTTLTPAGIAYREVAAWMTGKTMLSLKIESNGMYLVTLRDANNQTQRVVWHPTQSVQFAVPAAWGVTSKRDLAGATTPVTGASLGVGASPILLSGSAPPPPPPPGGNEIIVDNAAAGVSDASRRAFGKWCISTAPVKYGADSLVSCGTGLDTYRFIPTIPSQGRYQVYIRWSGQATNSKTVPVTVVHAAGTKSLLFDQSVGGGSWVLHGTYLLFAGAKGFVQITDSNGQASADAVRFVRVP
jgi:hypothetical protein